MEEWGENLLLLSISLLIPAGVLTASYVLHFDNILLTIALLTWIGAALVVLSPFMT